MCVYAACTQRVQLIVAVRYVGRCSSGPALGHVSESTGLQSSHDFGAYALMRHLRAASIAP